MKCVSTPNKICRAGANVDSFPDFSGLNNILQGLEVVHIL